METASTCILTGEIGYISPSVGDIEMETEQRQGREDGS
jgi:hypothetical protein